MEATFLEPEECFVLRRAFRSPGGVVVRGDIMSAFNVNGSRATRLLEKSVVQNSDYLVRSGNKVLKKLGALTPAIATAKDLLQHLDNGFFDFRYTGLNSDELNINVWRWCTYSPPGGDGVLTLVTEALIHKKSVIIQYVSMKKGDRGQWRRIVPLALDRVWDQWRLVAHDLGKNKGVRDFSLSRILDARVDNERIPRGFMRGNAYDSTRRIKIHLNDDFTAEQKKVIARELKVVDGSLEIPSRCLHEFYIRFAGGERSADMVWPVLLDKSVEA